LILHKFLKTKFKFQYLYLSIFIISQFFEFKFKRLNTLIEDLKSFEQSKIQNENSLELISRSIKLFNAFNISSCLFKSIVIYKLLKRNGQNPILHIGVKNIGDLEAHAWIEFEGKMLDDDLGYRVFTSIK